MVMVTVDIPNDINKMIEYFKVEHELKDKRDAIVKLLRECTKRHETESMDELFAKVNGMKQIKISPSDIARMKREVYS